MATYRVQYNKGVVTYDVQVEARSELEAKQKLAVFIMKELMKPVNVKDIKAKRV